MAERAYRLLLRAYPADFRRAFGDELVADFRRDQTRPRYRGARGKLRFWRHTLADWARTALTETRGSPPTASSRAIRARSKSDGSGYTEQGPGTRRRDDDDTSEHRRGAGTQPMAPFRRNPPRAWMQPRGSRGGRSESGGGWATILPLRQAARGLLRDPGYAIVAAVTLAVGISATTVVFALINGLLLTPLPLPEPDRLVEVGERERDDPSARMAAYGNWRDIAAEVDAFEELALFAWDAKTLTGVDTAQALRSREVSANFFRMLHVRPALGREFTDDEYVDGRHHVVILSHALWSDAFAADESILGRTVQLDATGHVVVGVMPAGFDFPASAQVWVPAMPPAAERMRRSHYFRMIGRLAGGADLPQAQEALDLLAARLEREFPETNENNYFAAYPLLDEYVGEARPALRLLAGAVGLVMLIACVNVAGLALARSAARRREIAMRRALGGGRGQLAGLVLSEGMVLGIAGGLLGLPLAVAGLRGLLVLAGDAIPRAENASMTLVVFVFAAVASVSAALASSLLPLLREARTGAAALAGGQIVGDASAILGRRVLVAAEVALAVILVAGAGLLGRSLVRLTSVPTGVVSDNVLTMNLALPNGKYPEPADTARFFDELLPQIESLPGVERAAVTLTEPANPFGWSTHLTIRDRPVPENEEPSASYVIVSPGYFDALGVPVIAGRAFTPADDLEGARVAILNRTAAERFWPDASPVGAMVLGSQGADGSWLRVVGVVEDIKQSLFEAPIPEVYVPVSADTVFSFVLVARTRGAPSSAGAPIRSAIAEADPDIPVTEVRSLDDRIGEQTTDARLYAGLMSSFALIALTLATVGIYGVLSYSVSLRRREFGVRAAIGASRGRVLRLVLREALVIAAVAVAAGTVATLLLGRFLASLLFEIAPSDPTTLIVVAATVPGVTLLASLVPAWRAATSDPLSALRAE